MVKEVDGVQNQPEPDLRQGESFQDLPPHLQEQQQRLKYSEWTEKTKWGALKFQISLPYLPPLKPQLFKLRK